MMKAISSTKESKMILLWCRWSNWIMKLLVWVLNLVKSCNAIFIHKNVKTLIKIMMMKTRKKWTFNDVSCFLLDILKGKTHKFFGNQPIGFIFCWIRIEINWKKSIVLVIIGNKFDAKIHISKVSNL
jgi:hypothetical protein